MEQYNKQAYVTIIEDIQPTPPKLSPDRLANDVRPRLELELR